MGSTQVYSKTQQDPIFSWKRVCVCEHVECSHSARHRCVSHTIVSFWSLLFLHPDNPISPICGTPLFPISQNLFFQVSHTILTHKCRCASLPFFFSLPTLPCSPLDCMFELYVEASLRVPVRECSDQGGSIDVVPYATTPPNVTPPVHLYTSGCFLMLSFSPPTSGEAASTSGGDAHTSHAQRRDPHTLPRLPVLPILGEATLPVHTLPVHTLPVLTLPILGEAPRTKPSSHSRPELAGLRPGFCSRSFSAPPPSRSARMSSQCMITCRVKRWEDRGPKTKKIAHPPQ